MNFDFNKINKFLNEEEAKLNRIKASQNNANKNIQTSSVSKSDVTTTPMTTPLVTPYESKIIKTSEQSIPTNYTLPTTVSNKNTIPQNYDTNAIEELNKNVTKVTSPSILKTPENFKDGYQFGDVTKTALSTVGDVASSGVEGILRFGEGLGDLAQYGVAGVADLFGADEFADSVRKNAQQDAISQLYDMTGINKLNENSLAGDTINSVAQGVGNVIAMANAGALLPKGMQSIGTKNFKLPTTSIVSGMGSGMSEAYNNGATDGEAFMYGLGSGLVEGFSESLFNGLGKKYLKVYGGGALDDVLIKSLSNKIGNKTLKVLAESGLKAVGEGTEEVISGSLNAVIKKLTYLSDEDFKKIVKDENLLEQFIMGTLTSAVMQTPGTINSIKTGSDYILNENVQNNTNIPTDEISVENDLNNIKNDSVSSNDLTLSFSEQVDNVINGTFPQRDMLLVSKNTPQVLQDIGLNDLPITITQKHLNTIMNSNGQYKGANYHDLGIDIVKQLPRAIAEPLNVLKSNTKDDSIVVITDLADNQERPVIASIKIDGKGQINDVQIDTNVMTSAYGRNNYEKFMEENIAKGNLLYDIDEGIIKKSDATDRVQFPVRSSSANASDIPKNISPISYNNNTTNLTTSQIEPLSSQYIMHQNTKNDTSKGITLSTASEIQNTNNVENTPKLPKAKKEIPQDPTKESSYDNNENKIAELLDKRPESQKTTLKDSAYKTIRSFVDKGEAISRLAKKTGNNQLYAKYDHIGTAEAEGQYAISVAQTDNNGNKIGKSIIGIWQPVEQAGLVEEFSNYLLHKHNISRWNQGKPVFGQEITSNISQKFVEDSEKQYPQFKEWSKDINTYNKNQMQNMVDAGLTSKESQEYLNNTYDNYIRIYRDIKGTSPVTQFKGNLKINVPIKKAKGGNQDILPLKDSMAQQTIEIKKAIRRNEFGLELLNVLDNGENVDYDGKQAIVKNDDGTYSFTIFKDGKPVKMEIDEGIYEALTPNKKYEVEKTLPLKAIQKVSQIQRSLLTDKNPLFIVTNFFKDIGDAPFNSKYSSKFLKNYVVAANEIKNNGELWNKYRALGGEQNTYFDYEKGIKMPTNSKTGKFVSKIQNLNHIIEQLPRFTEFISTLEAGGTEAQAMYNAAEITTNFKRGGDFAKALNRNGANFLNASIQGFDKQIRNFTNQNGAKGYVNLLAKATILGVLPSVLNHLLLDDDEEYQDLPDYIKDSYYLFKTGNGNFIRIPKGRVVSTFGMAARRTLEYSSGEKEAYNGMLNQVLNQVAPNNPLEDNIFAPFISIKNNRSWNGSQIVPQRLQNELPENQYDEKTDSISKTMGKIFKISPKKVNYILDQYTGGIGDIVLPMLTPEANENPISAKFTTNSIMNNKNVSDFYDTKDKLTKQSNSINASDEDILKSKYMNSINSQMNELYKQKREIQNSNLNNSEKLKQVKKIQQQINDIAKFALQDYENVYIDNNYSVIGNIEFYRNSNGEWTKINVLQNSKQNEISNKYDITPSEYYENREEYNYAYQYPQKYSLITNITTYDKYNEYSNKVSQIKDKYSNSTQRKQMVFEYINSLPYNKAQKIILFKMLGNYGISDYKNDVYNYINGLKISKKEKEQMWQQIYGK